jgi:selenocysteine-specific elongation factor
MTPALQHFILATAGHVDHGKSALVKALTGTDPDRLPEEKARGITIDLGFANLEIRSSKPPFSSYSLGIVDVPGHEDFVKNMVAGVGTIDLALLVVAADDGWMPQTEEHLQILTYLGVRQAVGVLTKIDLAQDEKSVTAAIREKLRATPFADAPIIPTSILSGSGLDELKSTLATVAARTLQPRDIAKPRLPVDRVFNLQGIGTVVTGTLMGGTLRRGQNVIVQPSGKPARIRNIQSHNQNVEIIGPGTRTALNLPNLIPEQDIHRGDVITRDEFGGSSETLDVLLEISPRASRSIKEGARVWIHYGSASVAANVIFFNSKKLNPGEHAVAQLRLEAPAFVFVGDRFVVRDWAEQYTLAGGKVLDAEADTASFRSAARVKFLQQRAEAPEDVRSGILSQLMRDGATERSRLLRKSRFGTAEISEAAAGLVAQGDIIAVGKYWADSAKWTALCRQAMDAIDNLHRAHPEDSGMPVNDLRATLQPDLPFDDLFDGLLRDLCSSGFVRVGAVIRRVEHRPALPAHLQPAGDRLREALARKPFDPPSRKELAADFASQQALRFLIQTGEAVEINADIVMGAESEKAATELISQFLREHGPATVSDLRQAIGSSRRVIIPLLERLDRAGIMERVADKRVLRRER